MEGSLPGVPGAPVAEAADSEACLSAGEAVHLQAMEGGRVMV